LVANYNSSSFSLYVNGNQQSITYSTSVSNQNGQINGVWSHTIGSQSATNYLDGYMTDINFIDGQALTPSSFGETDTTTGSWKPKAYSGTYGTNGFYLKFSDIATTSGSNAGLGKDFSGNANYWTTNNISVTSGTTYDAMIDSPTLTSATVANYAVMNPLQNPYSSTFSNANLTVATASGSGGIVFSSMAMSAGKYYWEITLSSGTSSDIGIFKTDATLSSSYLLEQAFGYSYVNNGQKFNNNTGTAYGASYTTGDIIGVAFDADNGTLTFYKNGSSQGTAFTSLTNGPYSAAFADTSGIASSTFNANFGQRPFAYSVPSGFTALNTFNLPTPTILQGNKYMDASLYTGTRTTQVVVNSGQFKPDMVWCKSRSFAAETLVSDSVRGTTKQLFTSRTDNEQTDSTMITSLNSNGFTLGDNSGGPIGNINYNIGATYVGWQWQAGQGSTSSNTAGSTTSTVSVNTTAGFSIVSWTGNGSNATVGHGLGVTPKMLILRPRTATGGSDWAVYHANLTSAQYVIFLNNTIAQTSYPTIFNSTAPTSTVLSVGSGYNVNAAPMIAYVWAEIAGFSKFGSYTGNGSADGPFSYTGFRPAFVMLKRTDSTSDWLILDNKRGPYNVNQPALIANGSSAEFTSTYEDFLSNGFKFRDAGSGLNVNGGTYIYMAFAENPFKNANAR